MNIIREPKKGRLRCRLPKASSEVIPGSPTRTYKDLDRDLKRKGTTLHKECRRWKEEAEHDLEECGVSPPPGEQQENVASQDGRSRGDS